MGETMSERKQIQDPQQPASNAHEAALVEHTLGRVFPAATPRARELTIAYVQKLVEWNRALDLTAAKSAEERVDLFVADAAELATLVEPGRRVVDIGTGAGAPGLVLALLRPDLHVTLVEPLAKRTSFMRSFWADRCRDHIPSLRILREKVEAMQGREERFEVALSRATFEPARWLQVGRELVVPGGEVHVFLAREEAPEAADGVQALPVHPYVWPHTGRERSIARYVIANG